MVASGSTTKFYYDGDSTRVLYETDGSNNVIVQYTYDSKGQLVSMTRGGVTYYYHFNGHGDVVALTDSTGVVVATYDYDAYGNQVSSTGSVVSPYRYAGYRYDSETGLYYLNARYYAPQLGRFINRDDFHGFEDEPASLNQYNYAESNPVMYVDPSGNWAQAAGTVLKGATMGGGLLTSAASLALVQGVGWVVAAGIVTGVAIGGMIYYKEHTKVTPSKRNKHEEGQTRMKRDKGNEKGDARRYPPRKAPKPKKKKIKP